MPTGNAAISISVGGVSFSGSVSRSAAGEISQSLTLTAGNAGILSTRSGNTDGVLTLDSDHTIIEADIVDVFWDGGCQYGCTATVTDTEVTISGGLGDNLPVEDTEIVVSTQQILDSDFDPDKVEMIACMADVTAHVDMQEDDDTSILALELTASEPWYWADENGYSRPFTGDPVGQVKVSNGTTTAGNFQLGLVYNSDE